MSSAYFFRVVSGTVRHGGTAGHPLGEGFSSLLCLFFRLPSSASAAARTTPAGKPAYAKSVLCCSRAALTLSSQDLLSADFRGDVEMVVFTTFVCAQ